MRWRLTSHFRWLSNISKDASRTPGNSQTGHIEIGQRDIVALQPSRFRKVMKLKHILNSILTVLFVFPFIGTSAQQAPSSGSIEVITTFDYPGTGNSTLPQKINEKGDVV